MYTCAYACDCKLLMFVFIFVYMVGWIGRSLWVGGRKSHKMNTWRVDVLSFLLNLNFHEQDSFLAVGPKAKLANQPTLDLTNDFLLPGVPTGLSVLIHFSPLRCCVPCCVIIAMVVPLVWKLKARRLSFDHFKQTPQ